MKFWPFSRKSNEDGSVRHSLDLFRLLAGWMGTKSGASVSHKSALEVPAVLSCVRVISAGCDPTSNYLKSNLQFFNINSTLRLIWYDQIHLLDSGD